jgi:hypothetical protein
VLDRPKAVVTIIDKLYRIVEICNELLKPWKKKGMLKKLCVVALCAVLASCSASGNKKVLNSSSIANRPIDNIEINYSKLSRIDVDLESLGYDGDGLALAMQQAQTSAAQSAGASGGAGAGLAGALIGGSIAQNMAISGAISEKNNRVPLLLAKMRSLNYEKMWQASQFAVNKESIHPKSADLKMVLTPKVSVTADYQSFLITVEVDVREGNKQKYRNYFYLQSDQIVDVQKGLPALEQKPAAWIQQQLEQTMQALPQLIALDLNTGNSAPAATAIRFKNSMGNFYERGSLLAKHEKHLTFKTLRGEVKHMPYTQMQ